jgi:hypothetical protein
MAQQGECHPPTNSHGLTDVAVILHVALVSQPLPEAVCPVAAQLYLSCDVTLLSHSGVQDAQAGGTPNKRQLALSKRPTC